MYRNSLTFLIILLLYHTNAKIVEIKCPDYCRCDEYENLYRAICHDKKIVSIEAGIPTNAQILDISYNHISALRENIFMNINLTNLKLLNISNNKVSDIHFAAFNGLTKLKTLDLSKNSMGYVLETWFKQLTSLEELYLSHNHLRSIKETLIESETLKIMDISYCGITALSDNQFSKIPNLQYLYLNENHLINLKLAVIKPLPNLLIFNVEKNPINCNSLIEDIKMYTVSKGIIFTHPCVSKKTGRKSDMKFERMVNDKSLEKNTWIYDDENIERCIKNITIISSCNETSTDNLLLSVITLSPSLTLVFPLIFGILIGLIIGCSVQCRPPRRKPTTETEQVGEELMQFRRRSGSRSSRKYNRGNQETLVDSVWDISESTPVTPRKNFNAYQQFETEYPYPYNQN